MIKYVWATKVAFCTKKVKLKINLAICTFQNCKDINNKKSDIFIHIFFNSEVNKIEINLIKMLKNLHLCIKRFFLQN